MSFNWGNSRAIHLCPAGVQVRSPPPPGPPTDTRRALGRVVGPVSPIRHAVAIGVRDNAVGDPLLGGIHLGRALRDEPETQAGAAIEGHVGDVNPGEDVGSGVARGVDIVARPVRGLTADRHNCPGSGGLGADWCGPILLQTCSVRMAAEISGVSGDGPPRIGESMAVGRGRTTSPDRSHKQVDRARVLWRIRPDGIHPAITRGGRLAIWQGARPPRDRARFRSRGGSSLRPRCRIWPDSGPRSPRWHVPPHGGAESALR
jgi:hypothetical protein